MRTILKMSKSDYKKYVTDNRSNTDISLYELLLSLYAIYYNSKIRITDLETYMKNNELIIPKYLKVFKMNKVKTYNYFREKNILKKAMCVNESITVDVLRFNYAQKQFIMFIEDNFNELTISNLFDNEYTNSLYDLSLHEYEKLYTKDLIKLISTTDFNINLYNDSALFESKFEKLFKSETILEKINGFNDKLETDFNELFNSI